MSVKIYAVIFGILFLVGGILGFVPTLTPNGYLLNLFLVDIVRNSFHVVLGILGLLVAFSSYASRIYFKIVAVVFLFLAVLGMMLNGDLVFMRFNTVDNLFHLIVGAIAVYLGFGKPRRDKVERKRRATVERK